MTAADKFRHDMEAAGMHVVEATINFKDTAPVCVVAYHDLARVLAATGLTVVVKRMDERGVIIWPLLP